MKTTRIVRWAIAAPALALLAACGSVPTKQYEVRAVDTEDKPVVCLVVIGDDWEGAQQAERYTTAEGWVPVVVSFKEPEVKLRAKAAILEDGVPRQMVSKNSESRYLDEYFRITTDDPAKVTFIMRRK